MLHRVGCAWKEENLVLHLCQTLKEASIVRAISLRHIEDAGHVYITALERISVSLPESPARYSPRGIVLRIIWTCSLTEGISRPRNSETFSVARDVSFGRRARNGNSSTGIG